MHESGENYLETIYLLSRDNPEVHAVDVANGLGFSKPSVTRALSILKSDGYIETDGQNHIKLTADGCKKAEEIYEKHQVITKFWILNGVSPEIAAKDACRMEHDISDETFLCIKRFVTTVNGKMTTDDCSPTQCVRSKAKCNLQIIVNGSID